ncbi:MAG: fatty acid desaturase [Rhodobacterales bacterium]
MERRAYTQPNGRCVIVEDRGILSLLFLNNNFHAVHHARPNLARYNLPAYYRENMDKFPGENRGYRYPDYRTVFTRFFLHTKKPVQHPL